MINPITTILVFLLAFSAFKTTQAAEAPFVVGDYHDIRISNDPTKSDIVPTIVSENVQTFRLEHPGATYLSVYFDTFKLSSTCTISIQDGSGTEAVSYAKGQGRQKRDKEFWATHVNGDVMDIVYSCQDDHVDEKDSQDEIEVRRQLKPKDKQSLFEITKYAAGFTEIQMEEQLAAFENVDADDPHNLVVRRNLQTGEIEKVPEFMDPEILASAHPRRMAVCGNDDRRDSKCYAGREEYEYAKPVARLLIAGRSLCTGWLVSSTSLLITNEHCINNAADALNTDYEFMAENGVCASSSNKGNQLASRNYKEIYDGK